MKILLIDDSALSKKMILRVFEATETDTAIETVTADGGEEGIALFSSAMPDMVFCDLLMPDMDGIEVVKKIRANDASVFIIVLSSDAQEERRKEAAAAGADHFVKKPLDIGKMQECISLYNTRNHL